MLSNTCRNEPSQLARSAQAEAALENHPPKSDAVAWKLLLGLALGLTSAALAVLGVL